MRFWTIGVALGLPALVAVLGPSGTPDRQPPAAARSVEASLPAPEPPRAAEPRPPAAPPRLAPKPRIAPETAALVGAPAVNSAAPPEPPAPSRAQRLQQAWESQREDEEWTEAAWSSLADMMATAGLDSEVVRSVACRATLCRIELEFGDFASANKLAHVMASNAQELEIVPLPAATTTDQGERANPAPHYLIYAARPGERIASLAGVEHGI